MRTLAPLLCLACAAPAPDPGEGRVLRRLTSMGTGLSVEVVAGDRAAALRASEQAVRALEGTEGRLSTWGEESELARLNAAPVGAPVELSAELASELGRARELWQRTDGAFDPGVGALVAAWDLRGSGRLPASGERAAALEASGLRHLTLEGARATRRHAGLSVEEGGFGKGAGLDHALDALRAAGARSAVLDLGGQVALLGTGPFEVEVAHPRERDRVVLTLRVPAGSVATSGNSERGRVVDGTPVGHLLDPRNGVPAHDFGSVTVWAPSALDADALSTALFVLGPDAALELASQLPDVEALLLEVRPDGSISARCTPGLGGRATIHPGGPERVAVHDPDRDNISP